MMRPPIETEASVKAELRTADYRRRQEVRQSNLNGVLAELIPSGKPSLWEIGCGHGHFLTEYAAKNPDQLCIGIDIIRDRITRAKRKRDRARLSNLHFVLAEAGQFLAALPAHARFSAIYILFPDPWPKRRHHKNRLLQPAFLDALTPFAGQGAHLYFRTDFEPYFQEVTKVIQSHAHWRCVEEAWPFERQTVFQSRADAFSSWSRKSALK